ncbi:MAG: TraR/DksA family transcriptional regulator [Bdellovibrionales bacterium]|nr:TraR/DksA family transcriptional regulator [Bdellovibrionales bacterium]
MKKRELDKFQKLLLEEKKKIIQHLADLTEFSEQELENGSGDAVDIASLEINQANISKIGKREAYLLKKIDYALKKIEDKTYGDCENCGEPINPKRLEARPVAALCIDCKTEQENSERRYSTRESEEDDNYMDDSAD